MSDDEVRRGADRFRELMRRSRWIGPLELIDPDVLEEIRRGAEPFRRALELARLMRQRGGLENLTTGMKSMYRYVMHHSRKERDMR